MRTAPPALAAASNASPRPSDRQGAGSSARANASSSAYRRRALLDASLQEILYDCCSTLEASMDENDRADFGKLRPLQPARDVRHVARLVGEHARGQARPPLAGVGAGVLVPARLARAMRSAAPTRWQTCGVLGACD